MSEQQWDGHERRAMPQVESPIENIRVALATVATELVSRCQGDSEEAVISRIALRELHTAIA